MRRSIKLLSLCLSIALFGTACQRDNPIDVNPYQVPDIIQPYIDLFEMEAAKRGINLTIDSLIVEFETELNEGQAAGLCTFPSARSPIPHITLDTTSFNWTNNEYHREILVFHELGHCVLDRRQHRDDFLPNGNISSMMRSTGEQVYGGSLNNFKREYYLDELFDVNTPAPEWATDFPRFEEGATYTRTPVLEEEFINNRNRWITGSNTEVSARIQNGRLFCESSSDNSFFNFINLPFDEDQDFELETSIRITGGSGLISLGWGGGIDSENRINGLTYFGFTNDTVASIGRVGVGISIVGEPQNFIRGFNKITVRKLGDEYHFYFNESYFDVMRFEPFAGEVLGFAINPQSRMEAEYLRIYQLQR